MRTITARNTQDALIEGLGYLHTCGVLRDSRNGPVIRAPGPVATVYVNSQERLVQIPERDANNVFHLMETIWMLAGSNDVTWLLPFNSKFGQYAEEDGKQHGAYGFRWRNQFGFDQLESLVKELSDNSTTRRAVLQMWDARLDLNKNKKDLPCNTHIYFSARDGFLDMTVCCRSNDIVWGAYGANAVHFSMLQELIAHAIGARVGTYIQFSNDYHLYTDIGPGMKLYGKAFINEAVCPYASGVYKTIPLLGPQEYLWDFLIDCEEFVSQPDPVLKTTFMRKVAKPIKSAYISRRDGYPGWRDFLAEVPDCDWLESFLEWTSRR